MHVCLCVIKQSLPGSQLKNSKSSTATKEDGVGVYPVKIIRNVSVRLPIVTLTVFHLKKKKKKKKKIIKQIRRGRITFTMCVYVRARVCGV